jgi:hypothetical protein
LCTFNIEKLQCDVLVITGTLSWSARGVVSSDCLPDTPCPCLTVCVLLSCCSWIRSFSRQKLEEAIAALLVLPCPQNVLIQRNSLDTLPVNALPVDSLLYVSRHLGRLCVHYVAVLWL